MTLTDRVLSSIMSNTKAAGERKIGVEVECIFYTKEGQRLPVNQGESFSACDLLFQLNKLQIPDTMKANYSIEPGGQLEWASPPLQGLYEIKDKFDIHRKRIYKLCQKYSIFPLDFALEPLYSPDSIELIDENKYKLMHNLFLKTGSHGPWMMKNTASIQVNIDVESIEEAEEMAFAADLLQPFCAILFSNSPFWKSKPAGYSNLRSVIWSNTDSNRCNDLKDHSIINSENLLTKYCEYMLSVPAMFVWDGQCNYQPFPGTLREWLTELINQNKLKPHHINLALHQIFTNVRFKNVIEIRGADRPPFGYELAPTAWWVGLLTSQQIRKKILKLFSGLTLDERNQLSALSFVLDWDQPAIDNKSILYWLKHISDLALEGLEERHHTLKVQDERDLLLPFLDEVFSKGLFSKQIQTQYDDQSKTLKQFLIKRYSIY